MSANANDVRSVFEPAIREVQRRKASAETLPDSDEVSHFCCDAATSMYSNLEIPDQKVALVSLGTAVTAPCPLDPTRPTLRVYGAFADRDEALEHAEVVRGVDPTCSLALVPCGEWFLMPIDEAMRDDPEARERRCQEHLAAHRAAQEQHRDEHRRAVAGGRCDTPYDTRPPMLTEEQEEEEEAERTVYKPPRKLRVGAEVRGQRVVVVSTIPHSAGECLVKVHACFDEVGDADGWIRGVASRIIVDDALMVAPTCEWIFPNAATHLEQKEHYRVGELQRIMDNAQGNPRVVRNFKQWKREQDRLHDLEDARRAAEAESPEAAGAPEAEVEPPLAARSPEDGVEIAPS